MNRFLVTFLVALTSASIGVAQTQGVSYETPQFSVTFNAKVEVWAEPNTKHTSVDNFYASKSGNVEQTVAYRTVSADIPVETSSLDFYVKQSMKHGEVLKSRQDGTHHGHIFAYYELLQKDGRLPRNWLIIYNSRTVFLLIQSVPSVEINDDEDWNTFANSFVINEKEGKACWLPEGCK